MASREAAVVQGEEVAHLLQAEGERAPAAAAASAVSLHAFVAVVSIGGLLFGFDTGVISGALPYIRDDLLQRYAGDPAALAHWQELIVSSAIAAAAAGSVAGGWLADAAGRRAALLAADGLFAAGALAMAAARDHWWLVAGRVLVGLGVGLASVTVPVFIAEAAPPGRRASLVSVNVLLITGGQFLAYVADYAFSFVPGTWRWMLGVAALPAVLQAGGLLLLPESPRWLAGKGRGVAAQRAAQRLGVSLTAPHGSPRHGGDERGGAAAEPVHAPAGGDSAAARGGTPWGMLRSRHVLRELHVGVGLQVLQQLCGINTVMYYTPSILQLAGLSNQAALLLSLVPAATNALGTLAGMRAIDRHGRRRLLLASIAAVVVALCALSGAFAAAERASPAVQPGGGAANATACPAPPAALPDCAACLRHSCAFCGGGNGAPGWCLALDAAAPPPACAPPARLALHGCPSPYTALVLACLVAYLAAFSPGLGPVPWAVNAEIYPLPVRGVATGLAATANWVANAAVAQTFLTLARTLGGSGAFLLYAAVAAAGFAWAWAFLPETAGLTLDAVQQLFGGGGGGAPWGPRRKGRSSDDEAEARAGAGP